jgi:hypothetical protein
LFLKLRYRTETESFIYKTQPKYNFDKRLPKSVCPDEHGGVDGVAALQADSHIIPREGLAGRRSLPLRQRVPLHLAEVRIFSRFLFSPGAGTH